MATLHSGDNPQAIPLVSDKTCYSRWFPVTQDQICAFAHVTGDHQWIHEAGAEHSGSPFRGPIAHGLLVLSFAITWARESGALGDATWVLYGFDNLRFRAPVRIGSRIRSATTVQGVKELAGRTLLGARLVMEIEDHRIPAFVADCLFLKLNRALDPQLNLSSSGVTL